MPKPKKEVGEPALTKDLTLTATPAEFDDGFVAALKGYREARAGLIEQAEVTKEVLQAAKEAAADDSDAYNRLMQEATHAAPKPLSMLTTVTFEAQLFSMPSSAATPPKLAP